MNVREQLLDTTARHLRSFWELHAPDGADPPSDDHIANAAGSLVSDLLARLTEPVAGSPHVAALAAELAIVADEAEIADAVATMPPNLDPTTVAAAATYLRRLVAAERGE